MHPPTLAKKDTIDATECAYAGLASLLQLANSSHTGNTHHGYIANMSSYNKATCGIQVPIHLLHVEGRAKFITAPFVWY